MEHVVLKAERREIIGKHVKNLRRSGLLPAILYGKHISPIPVAFDTREASRLLSHLSPSALIEIDLGTETHTALVREKQRNHLTGALLHVDFQVVSMTETIHARVSLELIGESPAVKLFGGVLVANMDDLEVECLPGDLPARIAVDISKLTEIGDTILVSELVLPPKVTVLEDPEALVVVVTAQEEKEPEAEAGSIEPEVVAKGKKEEEDF